MFRTVRRGAKEVRHLARGLREQSLAQGEHALDHAQNTALDHDKVFIHIAVVNEAAKRSDCLLGEILSSAGVGINEFAILVL